MGGARSDTAAVIAAGMRDRAAWLRLVLGLFLVFGLFHGSATILESDRGQRGLIVAALVVTATAAANWIVRRGSGVASLRQLGLVAPRPAGIVVAAGVTGLMLVAAWAFIRVMGMTAAFYPGWIELLPGLFAQGGVAEEALFRGYLFGHIRAGRTFWRAAWLSMVPFVAVHLVLFATMPWPIALASVLLASIISFPLAHLYELGGRTIWGPALLHFVIQSTVKVVVVSQGAEIFALAWMAASAVVPLLVFAFGVPKEDLGYSPRHAERH
jgi:membrane protease YdiL (CAAX protease family)